ncbi:MAG: hypothetical protein V3T58_07030 [Candidatus Hydrothermarchaeales archaeon]
MVLNTRLKPWKISVILLFSAIMVFSYTQYQGQRQAFLETRAGDLNFEFKKTQVQDSEMPDIKIFWYTDAVLMDIPILITNPRGRVVKLEDADFEIFIWGKLIERRRIKGLEIARNKTLLLEDIKIESDDFDWILAQAGAAAERPEDATIALRIDVYSYYPVKIGDIKLVRSKIGPTRIEGDVYVRFLMGGKTIDEAARQFVPSEPAS